MMVWTKTLIGAMLAEFRQRSALAALLDDLARDPRRLDDVGMDLSDLMIALRRAQRRDSPLRRWAWCQNRRRRMAQQHEW